MATSPVRLTGMASGLDTESMIKSLMDAQKLKYKKDTDKQQILTWQQDKWKDLNSKLYKLVTTDISKIRLQSSYMNKAVTLSDTSKADVTAGTNAPEGAHTLTFDKLANSQYVTGAKITKDSTGTTITPTSSTKLTSLGVDVDTVIKIGNGTYAKTLKVTADTKISELVDTAASAGLNANFDEVQDRFFISSKSSGTANSFQISAVKADGSNGNSQLLGLGLDALNADGTKVDTASTLSTVIAANDSKITYNGVEITGSSNTISVNGLTIKLKDKTAVGDKITVNVSTDNQKTYDMIKDFVKSYNSILGELNTLYYADPAKDYKPLSDDQKEAMTDDQVAKWEQKIKDSMLRRDTTIGSVLETMKTDMSSSVKVNGKTYSLASYGIQTSYAYSEKGLLHIFGDKDDSTYSMNEDKLMKGLQEDPETTIDVITGVASKLYSDMNDKMKSIPNVRSALTFYDDKYMATQQTEYTKKVKANESKLTDLENKYYKQFSAMESAISKLQSQSNSLAGMLGSK